MLEKITQEQFEQWLQQPFHIHYDAEQPPLQAELIEVSPLPAHGDAGRRPFAVILRHAGDRYLPQRIYTVEHAQMGRLDLFLVPIGPDSNGMRYEVIFN